MSWTHCLPNDRRVRRIFFLYNLAGWWSHVVPIWRLYPLHGWLASLYIPPHWSMTVHSILAGVSESSYPRTEILGDHSAQYCIWNWNISHDIIFNIFGLYKNVMSLCGRVQLTTCPDSGLEGGMSPPPQPVAPRAFVAKGQRTIHTVMKSL